MQTQRVRDTEPEMAIRRALHSRGHRYRVDVRPVPDVRRKADLVFVTARVAVFVDGCFWHGCPQHGHRRYRVNSNYWNAKIRRNRERDKETTERLLEAAWTVVRIWEHVPIPDAVAAVEDALRPPKTRSGNAPRSYQPRPSPQIRAS